MSRLSDSIVAYLRYPAKLLDIRFLVIFIAIMLVWSPQQKTGFSASIDRQLFQLAGLLQRPALDGSHYLRVHVPVEEMQRFLRDPPSARELIALFDEMSRSYVRSVAIVLPESLPTRTTADEILGSEVYAGLSLSDPAVINQLQTVSLGWKMLDSIRVNQKYVVAVSQANSQNSSYNVATVPGYSAGWFGFLVDPYPSLPDSVADIDRHIPLGSSRHLSQPLLWMSDSGFRHDAVLDVFLRQQGILNTENQVNGGIWLDNERSIRTSAQGVIYPRVTTDRHEQFGVVKLTVADILQQNVKRSVHDKTVVVGAVGDLNADRLLNGVMSLEQGYYAYLPDFYIWLNIGIVLVIVAFVLLVPYLSMQVGLLFFVMLLVAVILMQQIFLVAHSQWIPAGEWLVYLACAYGLALLRAINLGCFSPNNTSSLFSGYQQNLPTVNVNADWLGGIPAMIRRSGRLLQREPTVQREPVLQREPTLQETDNTDEHIADTVMMEAATIKETRRPSGQDRHRLLSVHAGIAPRPSSASGKKLGSYEILGELGRGAMGVVYLGFDPLMRRKVAIKTLHYNQFEPNELATLKERFFAEARAVGNLRHHNIVSMHTVKEEQNMAYIAMDYVAGNSLAFYTNKNNLLPVQMVYWIIAEVADALAYAHAAGVVHRDIKPSNILYDDKDQEVKVADFGVARVLDSTMARTRTGEVLGSPLYMSPEQIRGEKVIGQSDIFSLGVTFYQLLTGELPFKADNIAALTTQILQCKFVPVDELRELPSSARKIINKALQRKPEDRYTSALEMSAAIDNALKKDFG